LTKRRVPVLAEGLRDGLAPLGEGLGEGLTYGAEWLSGGRLAIPQFCPRDGCENGTFATLAAVRLHLKRQHPELTDRERTEACDTARIRCRKAVQAARAGVRD
jgi:hypothetical protein